MSASEQSQAINYLTMLDRIMTHGTTICPRGLEVKELQDYQLVVDSAIPFMTFEDRKYNIDYFKQEMRWKLGANKYDNSIEKHAKIWKDVKNPDGTFNSNYGQYWFGEQHGIWDVVMELIRDPDSRKAVIPMLNVSHMAPHVKDTVCTECVGFRIRNNLLNMSVHMRSSDVIFGLGTDIPTFAFLLRLVYALIKFHLHDSILPGAIVITAMSSHIYSRHYKMVKDILLKGEKGFIPTKMPIEVDAMKVIASRGNQSILRESGRLGVWLCD